MLKVPKWKTKEYTRTGWIGFGLFLFVWTVDGVLCLLDWPSLSNYVSARAEDQPVFMWIILGFVGWLMVHWFYGRFRKE